MIKYNFTGFYTLFAREMKRVFQLPMQIVFPPLITSILYIVVFGNFLGSRITDILPGIGYIDFMLPGLLMMNVINSAFSSTSSSIYGSKLQRTYEELLVAPLSYLEIVLGLVLSATARGVFIGLLIYAVAVWFTASSMAHFFWFVFFLVVTALTFAALGAIVGLWAKTFEHVNMPLAFVLTPLSFLGGVFHSVSNLPSWVQIVSQLNPIFYMVNGIRYSMIGVADLSLWSAGFFLIVASVLSCGVAVYLFKIGYGIRK